MSIIDLYDIEQMVRLFNVGFSKADRGTGGVFSVDMFGVQAVFNVVNFEYDYENWRYVTIDPSDNLEEKRLEMLWKLVKGGYFHYMREVYSRTFKDMFVLRNYDKLLIEKRLETFGDKPKYNYFKQLNSEAKDLSASFVMSKDPGFYDFLQE